MYLELFSLWQVLAFPNASKIRFVAIARAATSLDLDMNERRCIALLVFPDPVSPVNTIDCGSTLTFKRTLLAANKEKSLYGHRNAE